MLSLYDSHSGIFYIWVLINNTTNTVVLRLRCEYSVVVVNYTVYRRQKVLLVISIRI